MQKLIDFFLLRFPSLNIGGGFILLNESFLGND